MPGSRVVCVSRDSGARSDGWPAGDTKPKGFFAQIWQQTLWGFLAEPSYGGNRCYAGWRVLGYPGGRHRLGGYTPEQMMGRAQVDGVWGEKLRRPTGGGSKPD